jgi:4-hydroxy-2-oxoheptanedioate aldolase
VERARDFRDRIESGRPLAGTVVTVPDVALAELTASLVDFVWIDLEHGAIGVADVAPLAIAARAAGAASLVRLRGKDDQALGPALDAGVDGVVLPRVESERQAAAAARRLRHAPRGTRGAAARRASRYGLAPDGPDPVCVVQIESAAGLAEVEAIAAVDGIDALVVGCADLGASIAGEPALAGADALRAAIACVQRAAAAAGIASGVAGPDDPRVLAGLANGGSKLLVLGADLRLYAHALDAGVGRLRRELAPMAPESEEAHVGT